MSQSKNGILKTLFGGLLVGAIGAALLWFWAWPSLQEAWASDSWPNSSGVIHSSKIKTDRDSDGKKTYSLDLDYEYVVDGKTYLGSRIMVSDLQMQSSNKAKSLQRKYPQGKQVSVYYDPDLPDSCALETGAGIGSYLFVGVFGLIALLGGIAVVTAVFKFFILIFVLVFQR